MSSVGRDWSFIRNLLVQGAAIQQDYAAGNYASYEEYSARLDAAARERAQELQHLLRNGSIAPEESSAEN